MGDVVPQDHVLRQGFLARRVLLRARHIRHVPLDVHLRHHVFHAGELDLHALLGVDVTDVIVSTGVGASARYFR